MNADEMVQHQDLILFAYLVLPGFIGYFVSSLAVLYKASETKDRILECFERIHQLLKHCGTQFNAEILIYKTLHLLKVSPLCHFP